MPERDLRLSLPFSGGAWALGQVERIAPVRWSLATSSGAIRTSATPQRGRLACGWDVARPSGLGQDPADQPRVNVRHKFDVPDLVGEHKPEPPS